MSAHSYDPKCEELARSFLGEKADEADVRALAQEIQNAIEDWFAETGKQGV
jgi:hypothetical protein